MIKRHRKDRQRPISSPDDLLRIARRTSVPLTEAEAQMIAFGVYKRGTDEWNQRERLRLRIGNSCRAFGRLLPDDVSAVMDAQTGRVTKW